MFSDKSKVSSPGELKDTVIKTVNHYLSQVDKQHLHNFYDLVISEVEMSLFRIVMQHTKGNKTQAALILGINRGTLRKKLKFYNLLAGTAGKP